MTDIGRKVEVRNVPKPIKVPDIFKKDGTPQKDGAPEKERVLVGAH